MVDKIPHRRDENRSLTLLLLSEVCAADSPSMSLSGGGEGNNTAAYTWLKLNCFFNKGVRRT